jgi:hypothetical protein
MAVIFYCMRKQTHQPGNPPTFTKVAKSNDMIKVENNQPLIKLTHAKAKERHVSRHSFSRFLNAWEMNVNSLEFE